MILDFPNIKLLIFHFLIYKIFFLFQLAQYIRSDCNKTHPILKNNKCDSIYCSQQDYNSSVCIVNNAIIKIQWLTNIIPISNLKFRYIHPFLTKNKDLIIQTTSVLGTAQRRYYGLTDEGRYYFTNSKGEETPYYSIEAEGSNEDLSKYEGTATSVQFENENNDYFLSIGNKDSYTEIIDYKRNTITRKLSKQFYYMYIITEITSIFPLIRTTTNNDQKKYYFISFLTYDLVNTYYFMCKIYYFNSTDITNGYERVTNTYYQSAKRRISNCFQSPTTFYIFCFFQNNYLYFNIIVIEPKLELPYKLIQNIDSGEDATENEYIFFKGIYLINNAGFYLYYKSMSSNPTIAIKEWDGNSAIKDYNFEKFTLEKFNFNANALYNDLINFKSNQICFTAISPNKETLYIIIFNFYNECTKMVIRYYSIKLYELYNKKVLFDLRIIEFGNFLSLTSSLCSNSLCSSDSHDHYSYLIIFSYPNFTDIDFDLIQHLKYTSDNFTNINIDLTSYTNSSKIENNIFGYYYKGVKILSVPDNIKVFSLLSNNEIKQNYSLLQNENVSISISLENQTIKDEYIIKLALVVSEPEYINLNNYTIDADTSKGDENEKLYYTPKEYIGKTSYFKIIKNGLLSTNCENEECSLCTEGDGAKCIICKNDFTIIEGDKICKIPSMSTIPISIISSTVNTQINKCSNQQILNNNCSEIITDDQIDEIYKELQNFLKNNYTNENIILSSKNVAFQLSTLDEQNKKTSENIFISNVDIGECENIIRRQKNLKKEDNLTIIKIDIKSEDLKATYVQYEIYDPNKTKVDLSICKNTSIYINTPVYLSNEIESLYESLSESGYNLFNSNDSFYNDICSPYTSEKGIDIPMSDRQNEIYNNIKDYSICQNNCSFVYYNSTNKKSKCECSVQIEDIKTETKLISYKDELFKSFYKTLKNSNFLVLKCFKLTFSIEGQTNNIGSYIMSAIFLLLIIVIIIHFIIGRKKLHNIILNIIYQKKNIKLLNKKENYENLNTETKVKNKSKIISIKTSQKNQKNQKNKNNIKNNAKNTNNKNKQKVGPPPKQKPTGKKNIKRSSFINMYNNSASKLEDISTKKIQKNIGGSVKMLRRVSPRNKILKNKNNKINKINLIKNNISIFKKSLPSSMNFPEPIDSEKKRKISKDNTKITQSLNDQELNNLNYEEAISLDKRSYLQYYFSLLKKKHFLLFTFYPTNDYNLITMKISLFLLCFSLYFTTDALFFTDETMHNIYINNGDLEFLYQIPLILYSSIITSVISIILKQLSLSENTILKLKNEEIIDISIQKSNALERRIKIKFMIFYIFSFIFMAFFWYFISCFCAVYKNTQTILIEDTFLSFGLSMLYPIGLNLIPGIFRIIALRDPKKGRKSIYTLSKILALI